MAENKNWKQESPSMSSSTGHVQGNTVLTAPGQISHNLDTPVNCITAIHTTLYRGQASDRLQESSGQYWAVENNHTCHRRQNEWLLTEQPQGSATALTNVHMESTQDLIRNIIHRGRNKNNPRPYKITNGWMNRRQKDRKIPHPLEFLGKNSQRTRDSSWILKGRESLGGKNEGLKVERKLAMKGNSLKGRERGMCMYVYECPAQGSYEWARNFSMARRFEWASHWKMWCSNSRLLGNVKPT